MIEVATHNSLALAPTLTDDRSDHHSPLRAKAKGTDAQLSTRPRLLREQRGVHHDKRSLRMLRTKRFGNESYTILILVNLTPGQAWCANAKRCTPLWRANPVAVWRGRASYLIPRRGYRLIYLLMTPWIYALLYAPHHDAPA